MQRVTHFAPRNVLSFLLCVTAVALSSAPAQGQNAPGVSASEIKVGQTMPYSGPASAFGTTGKAEAAYFQMINDRGGVNGRKIRLISLDDAYSPPKTVEQTRRLVEQEDVFVLFSSLGTATNTAVQKYLNARKVPQLFIASVSNKWANPGGYPWSMAIPVPPKVEAVAYAKYILSAYPNGRIGVLYQNDDYGKDYLASLKAGLGDRAGKMIVAEVSYEPTDPLVDSQVVALQGAGADIFMNFSGPKAAAQAIRKVYDIGWKPAHFLAAPGSSLAAVLIPAGLEKSTGLLSATASKDPTDPTWRDDAATKEWLAWMAKYYPEGNIADSYSVAGYNYAEAFVQVLKQCGNDLTRENVMRQASNLRDVELPMLLPGIKINTSPSDYIPVEQVQLRRFDGKRWVRFGEIIGK